MMKRTPWWIGASVSLAAMVVLAHAGWQPVSAHEAQPPTLAQESQRGWQPLVSESQRASYERSRYAPAVRIGDLLVGSGVIGLARGADNGPEAQFRRAFQRLEAVLEAHGLDLGDVAEITTYHVNLGELGDDFIAVKDEFIPEPPYPAWTAIGVDRLFLDGALIEIRFTAAFPE